MSDKIYAGKDIANIVTEEFIRFKKNVGDRLGISVFDDDGCSSDKGCCKDKGCCTDKGCCKDDGCCDCLPTAFQNSANIEIFNEYILSNKDPIIQFFKNKGIEIDIGRIKDDEYKKKDNK